MSYASEVLVDSPLGLWLLDETSGTTAVDASGNGNDGTYTGSPALASTTLANLDPSPTFVDDTVTIPAIDVGTGPFTLEAVARLDAVAVRAEIFAEVYVDGILATIGLNSGGGDDDATMEAGYFTGPLIAPIYTWHTVPGALWVLGDTHHLAYTYDGTTGTFYVDGAVVGTHARAPFACNHGWRIGGRFDGATFWHGSIAGVALYDTALSSTRVAAHYDALTGTGPTTAAVAFTAAATLSAIPVPDPVTAAVTFTATGTLTVGPAALPAATLGAVTFGATGTLDVVARPVGRRRRLVVVDIAGAPYGELENATVGAITYGLNDDGEDFAFTLPIGDPKAHLLLEERFREVQVWRGDQLLAWGVAVRPSVDKANLAVSCKGVAWYLTRRNIGKAQRTNYVTNGDFEDGLASWEVGALSPFEPVVTRDPVWWDAYTTTSRALTGTHALYLEQIESTRPRYGVSASQFFVWSVPADTPEGSTWSLVARCFIPSASWRGPPADGTGIALARYSTTETVALAADDGGAPVLYPKPIESVIVTIDENTPRDVWTPLEATLMSPVTGQPEFVQVTLGCPDGAILWDRAMLALDEGERYFGVDQALIARGLVEHLQDPAYGKSDLNLSTDMPATGVLRDRTYLHHEHAGGADALAEFTTLVNGMDFSVAYTPTERIVRSHHPARGVYRPALALELGRNLADFAWTFDGETAADSVIVLGTGDGSDREEAAAVNAGAFTGGLTLEYVFSAPPDTPIDSLDDVAAEALTVATGPELLSVTCTSPMPGQVDPVGILGCGDTVPVRIRAGALVIDDTYRVVQLTITPDDTLDLTLNRRPR